MPGDGDQAGDHEGVGGAGGKEPGADPDNLTSREKTIPVKKAGEEPHVNAESLLAEVGIARSTYHCRLGTKIKRC